MAWNRNNNVEKNAVGHDKVARYQWKVVDEPGQMMLVEKGRLEVDPAYQRKENESKVKALASAWSWLSCGAIIVAKRPDGGMMVVDGQHRTMAARRRSDIQLLPCLVFAVGDVQKEAEGFLLANANRKPLNGVDKFKAQVVAGDPVAKVVQSLADAAGREISPYSSATVIRCVSCLYRHARDNEAALRRLWPIIVDLCRGEVLSERIVDALMFIECRMADGESLADTRWRSRILNVGYEELQSSMVKFAAAYKQGGARVWSLGVLEAINKGLRHRLTPKMASLEAA